MAMSNPPHPGAFIQEVYLEPNGMSGCELASKLGLGASTMSSVLNEASGVSPEMALRLSKALGRSAESWLSMQDKYDLWQAKQTLDLTNVTKIEFKYSKPLLVRSPTTPGSWLVNDRRYFENAHMLLAELEVLAAEVNKVWPKALSEAIKQEETTKTHWRLARKRDLLSDAVKVFSAMSVEAFLNFYGVLRLGPVLFDRKFELLGPVPKLKQLFELCDGVTLTETNPIVEVLDRIAKRRNSQVHPIVVEVSMPLTSKDREGDKIPDVAREAVSDMVCFFQEFEKLQPNVAHHLPKPFVADT